MASILGRECVAGIVSPEEGDSDMVLQPAAESVQSKRSELLRPQGETHPEAPQGETHPEAPQGETHPEAPQGETHPEAAQGETHPEAGGDPPGGPTGGDPPGGTTGGDPPRGGTGGNPPGGAAAGPSAMLRGGRVLAEAVLEMIEAINEVGAAGPLAGVEQQDLGARVAVIGSEEEEVHPVHQRPFSRPGVRLVEARLCCFLGVRERGSIIVTLTKKPSISYCSSA
ncbi:hypothetical protein WMY93_022635 [Mugilogobius chulae]|uniref:Uncharacterized protein n=1 Tax=Mugilogobius chulae TaxID=88201 RepID=A0AAW0N927_9GOBI